MCFKCDGFGERQNFPTRREYLSVAKQLIQVLNDGTFNLVRADCPLEEMFETPMPGDVVSHEFACSACGRQFVLSADTHHGHGSWNPA